MKNSGTLIAVGLGGLALLGAAALMAGGGSSAPVAGGKPGSSPSGGGGPGAGAGLQQGIKGAADDMGLTVGLGCAVTVTNLERAKSTAYRLGKAGPTLVQAQAKLFRFGACGVSEKLRPPRAEAADVYRVQVELWRGAIAGGHLQSFVARALMRDQLIQLALQGVPTGDLPTEP